MQCQICPENVVDWETSSNGMFLQAPVEAIHPRLANYVVRSVVEVVSPEELDCLFLRGSILIPENRHKVPAWDVDMVIVAQTADSAPLRQKIQEKWRSDMPKPDICFITAPQLKNAKSSFWIRLLLWHHSVVLFGNNPILDYQGELADSVTAERILKAMLVPLDLRMGKCSPTRPNLVATCQKRLLRLGGPLSLLNGGPFSRNPVRCSALISQCHPGLVSLVDLVCEDLLCQHVDESAVERLGILWGRILPHLPNRLFSDASTF